MTFLNLISSQNPHLVTFACSTFSSTSSIPFLNARKSLVSESTNVSVSDIKDAVETCLSWFEVLLKEEGRTQDSRRDSLLSIKNEEDNEIGGIDKPGNDSR